MTRDRQVSAAVRINGELRSTTTDVPADALFPIYSITKTLTAICVLRLVEKGSLALDDAVRHWLPEVNIPIRNHATDLDAEPQRRKVPAARIRTSSRRNYASTTRHRRRRGRRVP
jgi:CubicO group peptidase (beta-lactamase class C family)